MSNIEKHSSRLPAVLKMGLTEHLFHSISEEYNAIELIISIEQTGVNIKELSAYLDFIYRIDGRLSEYGYARYTHRPRI